MAVDKNKLEEEACVLRFYKIVLSWDYIRLLKESEVFNSYTTFFYYTVIFCFFPFSFSFRNSHRVIVGFVFLLNAY